MIFLIASEDTYYTQQFQKLKTVLLIEEEEIPCIRIFSTTFSLESSQKYKLPGELESEFFNKFLRAFKNREIQPYLKAETLT